MFISIGIALAIPRHAKMSPGGLVKSLPIGSSNMLLKRVSAWVYNMILTSIMELWRSSMIVSLNEHGLILEGERIWIASEDISILFFWRLYLEKKTHSRCFQLEKLVPWHRKITISKNTIERSSLRKIPSKVTIRSRKYHSITFCR